MQKLIAITAVFVAFTMPALASQRDRTAREDRPAHSREIREARHDCSTKPASEWMPITDVTAKLQEQGFTIRKIEIKSGCYEVRVTDDKGLSLELHLDADTAAIVRRREHN